MRLTKTYPNGTVTLDAEQFPQYRQDTIDREIRSFEPFAEAVKRLAEYEEAKKPTKADVNFMDLVACPTCEKFMFWKSYKHCPDCGQVLNWSDIYDE